MSAPRLFLSHAAADLHVAEALVKLTEAALVIDPAAIRCTSLPGYGLPGGAHTTHQLRNEVLEADLVLGLISRQSMGSTWVLFELGARWATGKQLIPVLGPESTAEILNGPLRELNALSTDSRPHLEQLLGQLAETLECRLLEHWRYSAQLDAVLALGAVARQRVLDDLDAVRAFFRRAERNWYYVAPVSRDTGFDKDRARAAMELLVELGEIEVKPAHFGPVYRSAG